MLCCAVLRCAALRCAALGWAGLGWAVLGCAVLCCAVLHTVLWLVWAVAGLVWAVAGLGGHTKFTQCDSSTIYLGWAGLSVAVPHVLAAHKAERAHKCNIQHLHAYR